VPTHCFYWTCCGTSYVCVAPTKEEAMTLILATDDAKIERVTRKQLEEDYVYSVLGEGEVFSVYAS
jgi:hypothetical protein